MISVNYSWNGGDAKKKIQAASWDNLRRAVVYFWTACQTALNISNPRPYLNPAPKGEPPHKRTGFGAAAVQYTLDEPKLTGRVGLLGNAPYMAIHELKDHPWLLATLKKVMPQLQAIVGGGKTV